MYVLISLDKQWSRWQKHLKTLKNLICNFKQDGYMWAKCKNCLYVYAYGYTSICIIISHNKITVSNCT